MRCVERKRQFRWKTVQGVAHTNLIEEYILLKKPLTHHGTNAIASSSLIEQLTRQGKNLWKTKLRPRLSWLLPKENRVNGSFLRKEKWKKKRFSKYFYWNFTFFIQSRRVRKHELIDNINAQRTIKDGNLQPPPAGNWKERQRLLWDNAIQKKDELLKECKFFIVIDHAFKCFVLKGRKIHWDSFFDGNEIYHDLNRQDNRKREKKRCIPRCFIFFSFFLIFFHTVILRCMSYFLFLSTHFLCFPQIFKGISI